MSHRFHVEQFGSGEIPEPIKLNIGVSVTKTPKNKPRKTTDIILGRRTLTTVSDVQEFLQRQIHCVVETTDSRNFTVTVPKEWHIESTRALLQEAWLLISKEEELDASGKPIIHVPHEAPVILPFTPLPKSPVEISPNSPAVAAIQTA